MKKNNILIMVAMIVAALASCPAPAAVKLPAVLSSHMVLQREMPVPIWGAAAPGEQVTVKFRDQVKTTVAGKDGKWLLKLDPLAVGEPAVLTVNELNLEDVVVGEVWLGSGQSNMDMPVRDYIKGDALLARAATNAWPEIRLLRQNNNAMWQRATPASIAGFSALLFAFGLPLHDGVRVPVGLLEGAVGGTPSGYWLSEEAYNADTGCQEVLRKFAATYNYDEKEKRYQQDLKQWEVAAAAAKTASNRPPVKPVAPQKPGESPRKIGNLYEAHIRPCIPYAIRGVLWDQGESGTAIHGVDQCTLMGALIRGWRKDWGQGDFPFIFMQKPSGGGCAADPTDPVTSKAEPYLRLPAHSGARTEFNRTAENHIQIMQYTNTAMVFCSDLGGGTHPSNKSGYGARAARVALGFVYGAKQEYYGPIYQSHTMEGGKIRVRFAHAGPGLVFRGGDKLTGFVIAGADRKFVWADATIDGATVVVSSPAVPAPVAVRYAGAARWANLFNPDGLPALMFRTDAW